MRARRYDRYVPREPWRLFRDLRAGPGSSRKQGAIAARIGRGELTRVRAELARAAGPGDPRRRHEDGHHGVDAWRGYS